VTSKPEVALVTILKLTFSLSRCSYINLPTAFTFLIINCCCCFSQVKVDAKTKSLLDEHKRKKKDAEKERRKDSDPKEEEEGETKGSDDDDEDDVGEMALHEDEIAKTGLTAIMHEFADDLCRDPPGGDLLSLIFL